MERAVFVSDLDRLPPPEEHYDRLYLGSEFCVRRLPGERGLHEALAAAARRQLGFTLVTPFLDEPGLTQTLALALALPAAATTEVVANDLGLLEALRDAGWEGTVVAGRLLTRQRRGPGFQSFGEIPAAAAAALRASALDSPAFVEHLVAHYGVRRFELDDLVQGITVPPLPAGVRLSLYRPWLLVTASRNCPWVLDGRTWDREGCARPCRGRLLRLTPNETCLSVEHGGGEGMVAARTLGEVPAVKRYGGGGVARSGGPPAARSSERAQQGSVSLASPACDPIAGRTSPMSTHSVAAPGAGKRMGESEGVRSDRTPQPWTGHDRGHDLPLILGGCAQFLEHRSDAPPPPGVDRIVWQPEVPA